MFHYSDEKNINKNKYVMMIIEEALKFIALYTYFDKFCKV